MAQNIMVTGINGFVGKHLARELSLGGHKVIGVSREPTIHPLLTELVSDYYVCDLCDEFAVDTLPLKDVDAIINLAGLAKVGDSFANPDLYMRINVAVISVIGRKLLSIGSKATVIAVSTGAVYDANQAMPLTEESRLINTGSPYALSKIAMENEVMALRNQGLNCAIVRPFNHIGPGQEGGFLVPDLYKNITEVSKTNDVLKVGDLTTRRDYTDVRDVVKAYAGLATAAQLGHAVYNVCSGRSIAGKQILDLLIATIGQTGKIAVEQDSSLIRPDDPKDLYGDNQRLYAQTGWQPTIPLAQTIHDVIT